MVRLEGSGVIEDAQGTSVYLLEDVVGHDCQAVNHGWVED